MLHTEYVFVKKYFESLLIRNPKKSSSLRRPYLSKPKNVKVSKTVISTPPHNGMALFDKTYSAMAVPITSCMSEPIMAISITKIRKKCFWLKKKKITVQEGIVWNLSY